MATKRRQYSRYSESQWDLFKEGLKNGLTTDKAAAAANIKTSTARTVAPRLRRELGVSRKAGRKPKPNPAPTPVTGASQTPQNGVSLPNERLTTGGSDTGDIRESAVKTLTPTPDWGVILPVLITAVERLAAGIDTLAAELRAGRRSTLSPSLNGTANHNGTAPNRRPPPHPDENLRSDIAAVLYEEEQRTLEEEEAEIRKAEREAFGWPNNLLFDGE